MVGPAAVLCRAVDLRPLLPLAVAGQLGLFDHLVGRGYVHARLLELAGLLHHQGGLELVGVLVLQSALPPVVALAFLLLLQDSALLDRPLKFGAGLDLRRYGSHRVDRASRRCLLLLHDAFSQRRLLRVALCDSTLQFSYLWPNLIDSRLLELLLQSPRHLAFLCCNGIHRVLVGRLGALPHS